MKVLVRIKGGPRSGNFSRTHFGRPGRRGGSVAVGSGFETDTIKTLHTYVDKKFAGREDLHAIVRDYDRGLRTNEEVIKVLGLTSRQFKMQIEGKYAVDADAEVRTEKLEREYVRVVGDYRSIDKYLQVVDDLEKEGHTIENYVQELDKSLQDPELLQIIPATNTSALHNNPITPIEDVTTTGDIWIRDMDDAMQAKSSALEVADIALESAGIKKTNAYRRIIEDTFPMEEAREYLSTDPNIFTTNLPVAELWKANISKAYRSLSKRDQQQFTNDLARMSRNAYELDRLPYQGEKTSKYINNGTLYRAYEWAARNSGVDYLGKNHGSLRDQFMKAAIAFSKGKTLPEVSAPLRS